MLVPVRPLHLFFPIIILHGPLAQGRGCCCRRWCRCCCRCAIVLSYIICVNYHCHCGQPSHHQDYPLGYQPSLVYSSDSSASTIHCLSCFSFWKKKAVYVPPQSSVWMARLCQKGLRERLDPGLATFCVYLLHFERRERGEERKEKKQHTEGGEENANQDCGRFSVSIQGIPPYWAVFL